MKVLIDPGHGGTDPGAIGVLGNGWTEDKIAWAISCCLYSELLSWGHSPSITRPANKYLWGETERSKTGLVKRASMAGIREYVLVSIHCNSFEDERAHGCEVLHRSHDTSSKRLAEIASEVISGKVNAHNRGAKDRNNLILLNHCRVPAIIVEPGFISNPTEAQGLAEIHIQHQIATGICESLELWHEEMVAMEDRENESRA